MTTIGGSKGRGCLVLGAALALAWGGCGKKDHGEHGGPAAGQGAATAGPAIDCAAFAKKMNACLDQFVPLYAKTDIGKMAGQDEPGKFDVDKAARRFRMRWQLEGVKMCTVGGMSVPFARRDPAWKKRFAACDASAPCATWAPCMANALGARM